MLIRQVLPVCCLCTVWDYFCKQAKERTGRGATGGGERANYCKVCVSGLGLERDLFLPASASALEAAPTFNRHKRSLCQPFFFPFCSASFIFPSPTFCPLHHPPPHASNPAISRPRSTLCPPHLFFTHPVHTSFRATLFT